MGVDVVRRGVVAAMATTGPGPREAPGAAGGRRVVSGCG